MGHAVTLASRIFIAEFEISGDANAHTLGHAVDLPDDNNYGDAWHQRLVGAQDLNFSIAGNVNLAGAGDSDTVIKSKMAVQDVPLIICHAGAAVGDPAEFGLVVNGQYTPSTQWGAVLKYGLNGQIASRRWVQGKVLWSPDTVISGTANGTQVLIGAVGSTQKLYVAIAVIAQNLTSMVVKVQSDTTGFPSSTDRKTFATVTGLTAAMPTPVDGPVTDTFFRAAVTAFTGTSAQMIVAAGIAA